MVLSKLKRYLYSPHFSIKEKSTAFFSLLLYQHAKQTRLICTNQLPNRPHNVVVQSPAPFLLGRNGCWTFRGTQSPRALPFTFSLCCPLNNRRRAAHSFKIDRLFFLSLFSCPSLTLLRLLILLFLLMSGNGHLNPGPIFPCSVCAENSFYIAPPLTYPLLPLLLIFLAPEKCFRTWVLTTYQSFYLSLSLRPIAPTSVLLPSTFRKLAGMTLPITLILTVLLQRNTRLFPLLLLFSPLWH